LAYNIRIENLKGVAKMRREELLKQGSELLLKKIEEAVYFDSKRFVAESFGFPLERRRRVREIVEQFLEEALEGRDWESLSEEEKTEVKKRFLRKIIGFHLRPEAWYDKTCQSSKWFDNFFELDDFVLLIDEDDDTVPCLCEYGYDKKRKKPVLLLKGVRIRSKTAAEAFFFDVFHTLDKLYGLCKKPSLLATYEIL